jgi:hypothetical protein
LLGLRVEDGLLLLNDSKERAMDDLDGLGVSTDERSSEDLVDGL